MSIKASLEQTYPSSPQALIPHAIAVATPQHAGLGDVLTWGHVQPLPAGTLVRVPLGARTVLGLVWASGVAVDPDMDIRAVTEVLSLPALPTAWRDLVAFAARYYQRGLGELALAVLPPELRKLDGAALARRARRKPRPAPDVAPAPRPEPNAEQVAALAAIAQAGQASRPPCLLLHGVTGSGKTEVYLRAAEAALAAGRQVLVLVPEINLTPQLEARFAGRFGAQRLVTLHSALTPARRLAHWLAALEGRADVVLGTRLAVFAPLPRLGLIVVDEEHDPSYKQQDGARYSARDLAVYLGHLSRVPVVLGSATPALETWRLAQQGRYRLLALHERVGAASLPTVRVVDMVQQPAPARGQAPAALSPPLIAAVSERLARGEQSLLFLNRRGYAPVLQCGACSWKSDCPHCSAWRVFHKADRSLRCHHCGYSVRVPRACPDCGNLDIHPLGRGTEQLAEQVTALWPAARVARIDADSTRLVGALEAQLAAVHAGEVDILVGTQMVTKGHDFRRMTLVAAVNPDGALYSEDFRAPERLFATLMQAAGRAGRASDSSLGSAEMWVQTASPTHALYRALAGHDYGAFATAQLAEREMAGLPPYSHLALLRVEAKTAAAAEAFARAARAAAQDWLAAQGEQGVRVYPPLPPAVARVAGLERRQMLIESASRAALQRLLAAWGPLLPALRGDGGERVARWALDVDPVVL